MVLNGRRIKALKAAFPYTIPIFAGFWFLGLAYGIYMNISGFSFVYPMIMSMVIFGGSLEFVAVTMLLAPFATLQTFIMTLMIQARHIFYGISMLEKYKDTGWKKAWLIFGMCDETFSINYTAEIPQDVDKGWFYFFTTLLDYLYWVGATALGGLLGHFLTLDTTGLDFALTALFVVLFLEQWKKKENRPAGIIGIACAAASLAVFGAENLVIPAMVLILAVLLGGRKRLCT